MFTLNKGIKKLIVSRLYFNIDNQMIIGFCKTRGGF